MRQGAGPRATVIEVFAKPRGPGNGKTEVADVLYDAFVGDNLANQPDRADVNSEIVGLIDDLGCANGCNGAEAETVLQASCAAVLSSGAVMIN